MSTSEATNQSSSEIKLTYPQEKHSYIYVILILLYFAILAFKIIPFIYNNDITALTAIISFSIGISTFIVFIIFIDIHTFINEYFFPISINDDGITRGKRYLAWKDLKEIKHGIFLNKKYPILRLITKESPSSFWSFKSSKKNINLNGYKFVYAEIIPKIKHHCPEIAIPKACEEMLQDIPKRKKNIRILLSSLVIVETIAILISMFILKNNFFYVFMFSSLSIQFTILNILINPTKLIDEDITNTMLRGFAILTPIFMMVIMFFYILIFPPLYVIESLLMTIAIIPLITVINPFKLNTIQKQIILFITILCTAYLISNTLNKPSYRITNISHFFNNDSSFTVWGKDGQYLTTYSFDENDRARSIYDTKYQLKIELPKHKGCDLIKYMDSNYVIRRFHNNDGIEQFFLYNFKSKNEIKIDEGTHICFSSKNPISANGEKLAWLNKSNDKTEIKIANIANDKIIPIDHKISLPPNVNWQAINWLDNNRIIMVGMIKEIEKKNHTRNKGRCFCSLKQLTLFTYNFDNNKTTTRSFDHKATEWYITNDYKYAFTKSDKASQKLHYINLETKNIIPLSGELPSWISDSNIAYRIIPQKKKLLFAQFDLKTGIEKPICEVRNNLILLGVSKSGQYALFSKGRWLSPANFSLLNIKNLEWRSGSYSGILMGHYTNNSLVLSNPNYSIWSPNNNRIILTSFNMQPFNKNKSTYQLFLYSPKD